VRSGRAAMTVDGRQVIAGPGDILVIGNWHSFPFALSSNGRTPPEPDIHAAMFRLMRRYFRMARTSVGVSSAPHPAH
jgi:hypothetical protein